MPEPEGPEFGPRDLLDWREESFQGHTRWRLDELGGLEGVQASCEPGNASGRFVEVEVDLEETPILEWRWAVEAMPEGHDERSRVGDDFAVRLYVIGEERTLRWRTRALNYVWSRSEETGSGWKNPYQRQVAMVALRTGLPDKPDWVTERRAPVPPP